MSPSPLDADQREALAALLYPQASPDLAAVRGRYAPRELPDGAFVTRFAPSPTGFIHIGSTMAALLCWKLAQQSGGVFILRIEDTDRRREVDDGVNLIIGALAKVGLANTEGPQLDGSQVGEHGPYQQSERLPLYHAHGRELVRRGHAYPCFMSAEELADIREQQRADNAPIGVWGQWARCRDLSVDDVKARLDAGEKFVLRLRSDASPGDKIDFRDRVRGKLTLTANLTDAVMLKSDGYPTYHFAHPIDDTLMGITLIIRGDEWLSTTPIHLQIFRFLDLERPPIAHIAPVAKQDGASRRKLSKRLDDEASMDYYHQAGYPPTAVLEYLLNLLDSAFEDWRAANPSASLHDFTLSVDNLSRASSLFDLVKLASVSREVVARLSTDELYAAVHAWATAHDPAFAALLDAEPEFGKAAMNIGRDAEPPRKDIACWSDVPTRFGFFFRSRFDGTLPAAYEALPDLGTDELLHVLEAFAGELAPGDGESSRDWFGRVKAHALDRGYAKSAKKVKKNPDAYPGAIGDFMAVLRVALTGSRQSPDLHGVMDILGAEEVARRLAACRAHVAGG